MSSRPRDRAEPETCLRCRGPLGPGSLDGVCSSCQSDVDSTLVLRDGGPTGHTDTAVLPVGSPASPNAGSVTWLPGNSAARYERLELLGRGGMGEVYRARQTDLDREVALKLVLDERSDDPMFLARFRREAVAMGRLNHPNIIAIHDFGEIDGRPFLAMEFVKGVSLRVRLRHGALPADEAFEWATQLCEAIAYAHELGIVHRDLKPENVLITDDDRVKVADFGLAKLVSGTQHVDLTAEGAILGTLRYMAPEQLAGARDVNERADVYSLGVMLYEFFTGQVPVGRFAPPSHVAAISRQVDAVVMKALDADPARRFASGRELATALARARRGEWSEAWPSASGRSDGSVAGNLTQAATNLIGRDDERQLLRALLATQRLVTLTGPGGIGKSRLAQQVGLDCGQDFVDGAWFVSLAELTEPKRVPGAIATALGLIEDARGFEAQLRAHLAEREMLLILDNFEQITSAAATVANLLAAAPSVRIVVTSRVALHVTGEHEFAVGPLAIPRPGASIAAVSLTAMSPAVALFVERARAVRPDFELVAANMSAVIEICRRLDGLPLAIELAAARVKLLDPASILARMTSSLKLLTGGARDLPARQQTMRAAIAWSYELLTGPQRTLLAWLSMLRGSFTVESVERFVGRCAIRDDVVIPRTGEPVEEFDVLDALTALVEHNLVRRVATEPSPRFALYETIREFGDEQLRSAGDPRGLRHAHAEWCLETVTRGEPQLTGADPSLVLAEWDAELPDFRAALAWWRGDGERPDDALRILGELWYYWVLRSTASEAIEEVAVVVQHPRATPDTPAFSRALHALGTLCYLRDRPREALAALQRALDIRREREPEEKAYATLGNLASVKRALGDLQGSRRDVVEVVGFQRRKGNARSLAVALSNLSLLDQLLGRLDDALASQKEALALYATMGDRRGESRQLLNLGRLEHQRGRCVEALAAFEACKSLCESIGDGSGRLNADLAIANSLTALKRYDEARQLFAQCATNLASDDSPSRRASFHIARGYLESRTGNMTCALADYLDAFRLRAGHQDFCGLGEVLVLLAEVFVEQGRFADAGRLLGAELRYREQLGYAHSLDTLADLDRVQQTIRDKLGEQDTLAAREQGRGMSLEQLTELATGASPTILASGPTNGRRA